MQLDVYGEVLDALFQARKAGLKSAEDGWRLEVAMIEAVERLWDQPDEGLWEVRGGRKCFTHSRVMTWVAVDRAIRSAEGYDLPAPLERWRALRETIHAQVCASGFDRELNSFVRFYGGQQLDASLLLIPLVGFLPPEDERVRGTLLAIERHLLREGFVARYDTAAGADGLPPGEGTFLACTFWYADNLVLQHRHAEARGVFDRLVGLCNDVGLLAEEYDTRARRLVGNFPQAFSHVGLVNTALNLARPHECPAQDRGERPE